MARKNNRRNAGLWFLGILGLILTAIGLRYASSSGWWTGMFSGGPQALQTVNTGANVLMSTTASPPSPSGSTPSDEGSPTPSPTTSSPAETGSDSESRRMW